MTTSGTYSFLVSRDDIIRMAGLYIGRLGRTESFTAQETTDCAMALNMLVKQWMGRQDFAPGLKMWTRQRADLVLSTQKYQYALGPTGDSWMAGVAANSAVNYLRCQTTAATASGSAVLTVGSTNVANFTVGDYIVVQMSNGDTFASTVLSKGASTVTMNATLTTGVAIGAYVWNYTTKGQRPLELVTAVLRDENSADMPLEFMTLQTYEMLPTKTMNTYSSDPTALYYEAQLTNGQLYLDVGSPTDTAKIIHIVYLRPVQDFNNPTDNPEYPAEWFRALCWGLAKDIAPMFNAEWTQGMERNTQEAIAMARESNAETTEFYFQPYASSAFEP